jgi:glyoxylase I family protein
VTTDLERPPLVGVHHLGFSVTSLERSIRFYCDVLGADLWREPYGGDRSSFTGRMALVVVGGLGLDLFEHQRNEGEGFDAARTGLDHFALGAQSIEELRGWASWLDECGVPHSEIRTLDGDIGAMFDFVDPDGIQLEFIYIDQAKLG